MKRSGPLRRQTPLRQQTPLRRTAIKRRRRNPQADFSPEVRDEVARRSGGICEWAKGDRCRSQATHMHHRRLRRSGDHSAANALHVCTTHHLYIHANVAESYEMGWLVRVN